MVPASSAVATEGEQARAREGAPRRPPSASPRRLISVRADRRRGTRASRTASSPAGRELAAVALEHVEDVGHPGALGVDLRERDREPRVVHRLGHVVEQAGAIAGEDLDDRVTGRGPIVEEDLGLDGGLRTLSPRRRAESRPQQVGRLHAPRADVVEVAREPAHDTLDALGAPVAVTDPEQVEGLALRAHGMREHLGAEDLEPARGDDGGDRGEQAGVVVGHDAERGRVRVARLHPAQVGGAPLAPLDDLDLLDDRGRVAREEVPLGESRHEAVEEGARTDPRGANRVDDARDVLGVGGGATGEVALGREVQLLEHPRLPRGERRWATSSRRRRR